MWGWLYSYNIHLALQSSETLLISMSFQSHKYNLKRMAVFYRMYYACRKSFISNTSAVRTSHETIILNVNRTHQILLETAGRIAHLNNKYTTLFTAKFMWTTFIRIQVCMINSCWVCVVIILVYNDKYSGQQKRRIFHVLCAPFQLKQFNRDLFRHIASLDHNV